MNLAEQSTSQVLLTETQEHPGPSRFDNVATVGFGPPYTGESPAVDIDPRLVMTDVDPGIIREQVMTGLQDGNSPSPRGFLNNFPDSLPGGRLREAMERRGLLDKPRYNHVTWSESQRSAHSDLVIGQTYGQFYKDVEEAVDQAKRGFLPDERLRFEDPMLTAYALLRHKGYTHLDLW